MKSLLSFFLMIPIVGSLISIRTRYRKKTIRDFVRSKLTSSVVKA